MSRTTVCFMAGLVMAAAFDAAAADCSVEQKYRPKLFKRFGDHVNVPDGLAKDKRGNVYCAAPNFVDQSYPGAIMKMCGKKG
ncbi:MAG: hypothetical protein PHG96_01395, partial [Kiritimatiellae bacterium]|nr:hypothetical protein [Kiritimatiellia bacterium]